MMFEFLESILAVIVVLLAVTYWLRYMKIRELAVNYCTQRCTQKHYELLDDMITLHKTYFAFRKRHIIITREFHFDYAAANSQRHSGKITLVNNVITCFSWHISPHITPDNTTPAKIIPFPKKDNRKKYT